MNRKALLIGAPGTKDGPDRFLEGVDVDLYKYINFLISPLGGAWKANEIIVLNSPSATSVRAHVAWLKDADYSFTMFTGHGYFSNQALSTIVCLQPDADLDSAELKVGARKHTLLLDCCRVGIPFVRKLAEDSAGLEVLAKAGLDAQKCREAYDDYLNVCPPGLIVLNSCSIGETSADMQGFGGLYCASLIVNAEKWKVSGASRAANSSSILDVVTAHQQTRTDVLRQSGNRQDPKIMSPRSGSTFPFAVVA